MTHRTLLAGSYFSTLTFMLLLLFGLLLASCGNSEKVYRIGVSQCSDDDWRSKMNEEIRRELIFHDNAIVEIRSADDSNEKQIDDIKYFVDKGFDIIIAAPNEADALTPVITEVFESGIPVLLFDRNINGEAFTAYQGADNRLLGQSAGRLAESLVDGECRVIELYGLRGSTPADDRHNGFIEYLSSPGSRLTLLGTGFGNWNGPDAAAVTDSLLDLYPSANFIFAHNDRMAIAAAETARRRGRQDIKVIGIDAAPEIGIKAVADSVIDATLLYPTEGYGLIQTALAILEGQPYERLITLPAASVVDISNASILLAQNEELKKETSRISWLKGKVDAYWDKHSAQTGLLYAVIVIAVLLCGLIFVLLRANNLRKIHQEKLSQQNKLLEDQRDREKALNQQLQAATQSKLVFYTNVSHDLRTPLTLIAAPLDQLDGAENLTSAQQGMVKIANKNVKILMRLINQILDFRKYENDKLGLTLSEVDPATLVSEWCDSFRSVADGRNIRFSCDIQTSPGFHLAVDAEKLERVMFNLISNAFKYTPTDGTVAVEMHNERDRLFISVRDTGKGISAEDLSHIFERFFQVDKVHPNGSGIGLSLAKAFIELHGGNIEVESNLGEGSIFTVVLPVSHVSAEAAHCVSGITAADVDLELQQIQPVDEGVDADRTSVLVIDDNPDIRSLVSTLLSRDYLVLTASDGREGLEMARKYVPDLVICDVMMPVMDGLECCREIKNDPATSHIPVLMLTACSMDEQRIQGYECGADAYLSKPFTPAVLIARCRALIENRRRIMALWPAEPTKVAVSQDRRADEEKSLSLPSEPDPIDNEFYRRFCGLVEKNLSDTELSIDSLAGMMGLGRTQFYRKLKALTGFSPVELLRNMRLEKARTLLRDTDKSASEIAYEVGFSTPAYFGKCYKDKYGETPLETRGCSSET